MRGSRSGPTARRRSRPSSATWSSTVPRRFIPRTPRPSPADIAGAFPEGFYSTTNQPTQVRLDGRWVDVRRPGDGLRDRGRAAPGEAALHSDEPGRAWACRSWSATPGVRVLPVERPREVSMFGFMSSTVSSEKPKSISVKAVVDAIRATRAEGKKVCWSAARRSCTPARRAHVARLIREGWVQVLFAGNALATHDIEQALYGTSLGVSLALGEPIEHGHEHHLRAINTIRRSGGIARAVESGVLTSGIMYECVKAGRRRRSRRLDPRRRPAARRDHRHARRPGPDARRRSTASASRS